jgi:hypothetical protein
MGAPEVLLQLRAGALIAQREVHKGMACTYGVSMCEPVLFQSADDCIAMAAAPSPWPAAAFASWTKFSAVLGHTSALICDMDVVVTGALVDILAIQDRVH